jgi:ABC-2 type transport system permease protein
VIYSFLTYEIKRSLARKKVLVLVAFVLLLDTLPYYALSTSARSIIPAALNPYVWIAGVLVPQPLFIQFVAIFIAAGAMSEEYEQGTAELLMSKPVSRMEYLAGKFLGGYVLLVLIVGLSTFVSLTSSYLAFGTQLGLDILPGAFLVSVFAALLFFAISFMLGELFRRSSLAYIFASAVLFTSEIVGFYAQFIYSLTGNQLYRALQMYLPTSPVDSLPLQYVTTNLPINAAGLIQLLPISGSVESSMLESVSLILLYSVCAIVVFVLYFRYMDISRKVS